MAYIRKYKTGSGATGVQVCYKEQGRVVRTVQVGSAMSEEALEKLLRKARGLRDGEIHRCLTRTDIIKNKASDVKHFAVVCCKNVSYLKTSAKRAEGCVS